jgi:integrase
LTLHNRLIAMLIYGSGLRINEVLRLRVKDVDFGMQQLVVRSGKGNKDRITLLPDSLIQSLTRQIEAALHQHSSDLAIRRLLTFPAAFRNALYVDMPDQANGGANQELETANNEQPDGRFLMFGKQKQDAAHQKPDGDQEIIDDAEHFVTAPYNQFFMA